MRESGDWRPERLVADIVPCDAGGAADASSRMVASMLQREQGVPFDMVSRTNGNGVAGRSAIARGV